MHKRQIEPDDSWLWMTMGHDLYGEINFYTNKDTEMC